MKLSKYINNYFEDNKTSNDKLLLFCLNQNTKIEKLLHLFYLEAEVCSVPYRNKQNIISGLLRMQDYYKFLEWADKQDSKVLIKAGFTYHEVLNYEVLTKIKN